MFSDLERRIHLVAADRQRGAAELLGELLPLLREGLATGAPMLPICKALVAGQPSMASFWTASAHALAAVSRPEHFERFAQQVARAPRAIGRNAVAVLLDAPAEAPLRLVTLSFSSSVLHVIDALREYRTVEVCCAEGRPGLEGRRLATELVGRGVGVTCYADAALAHALAAADAVLVGADAVTPDSFLNKSGTRMLAAAAAQRGTPLYVVASRDKFVPAAAAAHLQIGEGRPSEVWSAPPSGVIVRNPLFEATPLDLVSAVISDLGVLGTAMVPDACEASSAMINPGDAASLYSDR